MLCGILPAVLLLSGCANTGQPHPPSLRLPAPVTDLRAERTGTDVRLTWTTSFNTTDKQTIRRPITALLCREPVPDTPARKPQPCVRFASVATPSGPSSFTDPLPPALANGPVTLLLYRIELANPAGRTAGPSLPAFAAAGTAPPPTGPITARPTPTGALIQWTPTADSAPTELTRTLVVAAPRPAKPSSTPLDAPTTPAVQRLQSRPEARQADPGGLLDPAVHTGDTYTYTAQRIRTVTLAGHTLQLHGVPSPPVTLLYADVFPPHTPTGLLAIPTSGTAAAPSIDLSWDANPEPDLRGYNIERADIPNNRPSAPYRRLNPTPLPGPAYRDLAVQPGHTYRYRVTAIDTLGNQSPPSTPLTQPLD